MGLVIVALTARFHGYDALPDPLGWLLVVSGIGALTREADPPYPERGTLRTLAWLAGAVSVALWFPAVTDGLYDADPSLGWAANLPQVAFTAVLCHALLHRADAASDLRAARRLTLMRTVVIVVALLPVLVFGARLESLETTSYLLASVAMLALIWLLFTYSSRPWANEPVQSASTNEALDS
jgi:hypothetical protein